MSSTVQKRSVLRDRHFRRFWTATSVSLLGSEISELALPLLAITTLHASASQVGWLRAAQFLPFLLATIWAGAIVDRHRRRPLMITADIARVVLIGSIPVLVWSGVGTVSWLLPVVFLGGVATVLHEVASYAYLPTLIGDDRLIDANGWVGSAQSVAQVGGRGIGGVLVAVTSPAIGVLADACSYLLSAIGLQRVGQAEPHPAPGDQTHPGLRDTVRDSVGFVFSHPLVRPLLGEAAICNFFVEVFTTGLLIHATRTAHLSPIAIGSIFAIGAIGATLGASVASRISAKIGFGRTISAAIVAGNAGTMLAFAVGNTTTTTAVALSAAMFIFGAGSSIANIHAISLRQVTAPNAMQARLNSGYRFVSWGAISLGAIAGGAITGAVGGRSAMWIGAIGMQLAGICVLTSAIPHLRTLPLDHEADDRVTVCQPVG
jgi:MFS family permease